ncbi:hypothetical protein CC86DRAFT_5754 [Ophiobolus disseminans]|uniref:F-box domain-containing protein n=1 Tax=Ophiobolus disseminans TaxID=1469910 RepID=A0A6A7AIN1_9PLEO|nr:hypothetical protein CC86DRAFT_5754 [Ophiobolus disseminans]
MPQRRLEHYFVPSRAPAVPSGLSFLDLPHSVRKLIYIYAGLDGLFDDLNYSNLKVYPKGAYPRTDYCRRLDSRSRYDLKKLDVAGPDEVWEMNDDSEDVKTYGKSLWGGAYGVAQSMLLVSRQIHQEVEAFVYAGAVFRVCLGQPLESRRLRRMSDHALSNLGALTIRLDVPQSIVENDGWEVHTPPKHLDFSKKWGRQVLKTWSSTLERLAVSIKPGRLRLRVVFRAKTIDDARAVVEPLLRLPLLKDCGICVDLEGQSCWWELNPQGYYSNRTNYRPPRPRNEDTEISRLVQQIVRKLTYVENRRNEPFRYLDLPQELRFAILEYTDLVSPVAVQWRPRNWSRHAPICTYDIDSNNRLMNESRPPYSCPCEPGKNTDDAVEWYDCCQSCSPEDHSGICYCLLARDYIWSSSCSCPVPRQALFAVSGQLRRDALAVYYSANEILITSFDSPIMRLNRSWDYDFSPEGLHSLPKIELSLYLSSIARDALQHIRSLEWILPNLQQAYLSPGTPAWFDYLDTLLLMENAMNLAALTFTINISAAESGVFHYWAYDWYPRKPLSPEACAWYQTIVLPVRRLGEAGLKNFFVYLRWHLVEHQDREHHEQELERAIMGEDYDSAKRGKGLARGHQDCLDRRDKEERASQQ